MTVSLLLFPNSLKTMRYSIMLQLVAGITLVLVGAAALFAWIQNRPNEMADTGLQNEQVAD